MDMRAYEVEMIRDGKVKYFFIRNMETMEIELLPTRFLTHKTRAQESPNTVGSLARSICYYMNFCDGRQMGFTDVCQMDYEAQFNHFTDFLQWLKAGNHTKNLKKTPRNRTCNTYLKNVFGFFSFLEMAEDQFGPLQGILCQSAQLIFAGGGYASSEITRCQFVRAIHQSFYRSQQTARQWECRQRR